jgi:hypothetical protein
MKHLILIVIASAALHYAWESMHVGLYTGYAGISGPLPITVWATMGDVGYVFAAVLFVSIFKRNVTWLARPHAYDYAGLAILGFLIALFVEYKALAFGKWAYTAAMPMVPLLHVGLSPLLQMTVLLPLSVYLVAFFVVGDD